MASKIIISQQGDNLNALNDLIELVKNPKLLTAAQKEYRKQIALTEAEETKASEARDYIAKHETFSKKLQSKVADLETDKALHENKVSEFNESANLRKKELQDLSDTLDKKSAGLSDKEKQLKSLQDNLETLKTSQEQMEREALNDLAKQKAKISKDQESNELEAQRLSVLRAELQQKADKIRESVTNF